MTHTTEFRIIATDSFDIADISIMNAKQNGTALFIVGPESAWEEFNYPGSRAQQLPGTCRFTIKPLHEQKGFEYEVHPKVFEIINMLLNPEDSGYLPGPRTFVVYTPAMAKGT